MFDVSSLKLSREILPFFDHTCNDNARDKIIWLLNTPPGSVAGITARQDILKGFMSNKDITQRYGYAKINFAGVHSFVQGIVNRDYVPEHKYFKFRLDILFSEREKHMIVPKLAQFIELFYTLYQKSFSLIRPEAFPPDFSRKIEFIQLFLGQFELEKYARLLNNGQLHIKSVFDLVLLIEKKAIAAEFDIFWDHLFLFEAYLSIATGIQKYHFVFPEFTDHTFSLSDFYHPLISGPVKNSFTTDRNVILITGPNMSGKSTLLKSIGLCVYLAHIGCAVPADKCALPFFESISIAVNLDDDLQNGYSHFMAEIRNFKKVVLEANEMKPCFCIFDEMYKGTNTEDALQLMEKTIKGLSKFQTSYFFISTHLHQVKDSIGSDQSKVDTYFLACDLNNNKPEFSYRLEKGWSDLKIGQILFNQEGLDELLAN